MPCGNHDHEHPPWPDEGVHEFVIEACENRCGWCRYQTKSANNLRVHARRHIANENETRLRGITIVKGKAGRKRVQIAKRRFLASEARDGSPNDHQWDESTKEDRASGDDVDKMDSNGLNSQPLLKVYEVDHKSNSRSCPEPRRTYIQKSMQEVANLSSHSTPAGVTKHSSTCTPRRDLREYRNVDLDGAGEEQVVGCTVNLGNWRCSQCLCYNVGRGNDWKCLFCGVTCEEYRIKDSEKSTPSSFELPRPQQQPFLLQPFANAGITSNAATELPSIETETDIDSSDSEQWDEPSGRSQPFRAYAGPSCPKQNCGLGFDTPTKLSRHLRESHDILPVYRGPRAFNKI